ncbi:hypothetical protein RclHR1_00380028 [Rhizophagus clarus]|uniref:NADH:ubiquinone oxidoreductase kDa subunit n=1 Tax=Rhizophagus clarus TaxID=94130 RepID=A0A2Z6RTC8_9GLOM|nr:hypothetical protein RclHR1_00380028 [Rhizophagus clarus]GET01503.1 NADH:ubiquinone oxidoreductase kDa subunit [Rhizophagus clarus]
MNVLTRSNNIINILKQTISHNNTFSRYSFIYYSKYYATKGPKTDEITDTLTMNATTENTSVDVPNYKSTWSKSQRSRLEAMDGPRFEQTNLDAQPRPLPAIDLIAEEPIRYVEGRVAVCDGGKGALGHPQIYINLDHPGAHACGYCGIRFEQKHHH